MRRILVTNDDGVHSEGIRALADALAHLGGVNIAITHVIKDKPDLIVSGINKGWNLGDDVTYSGTVSGALEGALLGIPSIAVSTQNRRNEFEYGPAGKAAAAAA